MIDVSFEDLLRGQKSGTEISRIEEGFGAT
jgi:hypothetical protein